MSEALWISHVLLWGLVIVLAGVVVALTRQIGVLHERVAPAGALVGGEAPRVGEVAPVLEVTDWTGRGSRVGGVDPRGRDTLLFFTSPTCPVCKTLLPVARSLARSREPALRLVVASDGPRAQHEAFVRRHGLAAERYVLSGALGRAFQVGRLPHAVLLDAEGVVRARGLVNTREHLESLFEARDHGVASVQEYRARRDAGSLPGRIGT
jgi:methylamine dehydrogenase accessory protein MauD